MMVYLHHHHIYMLHPSLGSVAETQPIFTCRLRGLLTRLPLGLQWDQWLGKNATGKLGVLRDPARPGMAGGCWNS